MKPSGLKVWDHREISRTFLSYEIIWKYSSTSETVTNVLKVSGNVQKPTGKDEVILKYWDVWKICKPSRNISLETARYVTRLRMLQSRSWRGKCMMPPQKYTSSQQYWSPRILWRGRAQVVPAWSGKSKKVDLKEFLEEAKPHVVRAWFLGRAYWSIFWIVWRGQVTSCASLVGTD